MVTDELASRFWAKVDKRGADDCWHWTGSKSKQGYGKIRSPFGQLATHAALTIDGRPRQNDAHALHSCDSPSCVNPAHLRWGTNAENVAEKLAKGRARYITGDAHYTRQKPHLAPRGERNARARLTEEQVRIIKATPNVRGSGIKLAAELGVTPAMVSWVRCGKTWKHVV